MADEEVVDAEAGTLNKQASPLDHLRHLLNIGWKDTDPVVQDFVEKYGLDDELQQMAAQSYSGGTH